MSLAVSAELRAELARRGYNVQSFARVSNLPVSTLHKTLKGQRVVDVEDLFNICEALGVDAAEIIDRASREALRRIGHGLLWLEGDTEDEPSDDAGEGRVTDLNERRSERGRPTETNVGASSEDGPTRSLRAVAKKRSKDRGGEDGQG